MTEDVAARSATDADELIDAPPDVDSDAADGDATVLDRPTAARPPVMRRIVHRVEQVHPALWLTLAGVLAFTIVFGSLGVRHHENFGSWSFDLGIYDQGFWLVSRFGQTFMTVRGLEFWGQHVNLVAVAYAPFYWLGAGPAFLYISQAFVLGLGALPAYLIARDRFQRPWIGLAFALAYLMYAPIQWISWANFHPEALVITPFLFAWWFATRRQWGWFFTFVGLALATPRGHRAGGRAARRRAARALLAQRASRRPADGDRHDRPRRGLVPVRDPLIIPWAQRRPPALLPRVLLRQLRRDLPGDRQEHPPPPRPRRARRHPTRPDPVLSRPAAAVRRAAAPAPLELLIALPQLLASVIGASPYARMISYQYTAVMIAPIVIAAIEGAHKLWRFGVVRRLLVPWLLVFAYVANVAWSPSPIGNEYSAWVKHNPREASLQHAVSMVPDGASVTATYGLLPHLSHREQIYDWPNPFQASYWGNDDTYRLPDPSTIDYLVIDRQQVGAAQKGLLAQLTDGDPYRILYDRQDVVVAQRVKPG